MKELQLKKIQWEDLKYQKNYIYEQIQLATGSQSKSHEKREKIVTQKSDFE